MGVRVRHLVALDRALSAGAAFTYRGRDYTFSPLTFGDYKEHMAYRKAEAMKVYLAAAPVMPNDPRERTQRRWDLNSIATRSPTEEDFSLASPDNVIHLAWLSLRHKHPAMGQEEVEGMINDEALREQIADMLQIVNGGLDDDKPAEAGKSAENPT